MPLKSALIDRIDKNIRSIMGRTNLPGMVVGVVYDGQPAWIQGYGYTNLANQTPVTSSSVFRIASISKVLTAFAVLQLIEDGILSLDDPVNHHLAEFQVKSARPEDPPITIRHLLTHTGGLGELAPLLSYANFRSPFGVALKRQRLITLPEFYRNRFKADVSPSEKWAYANHGFAILGQIVGEVCGSSFPQVVREKIFQPLGMDHSDFLREPHVEDELVTGYWKFLGGLRPVLDVNIITLADGSLFTTADDFIKFLSILSTDGGDVLPPMQLKNMFLPYFQLDPRLPAMGLGIFMESRQRWNGYRVGTHDGLWLGFHSSMYVAPKQGVGVFAFANGPGSGALTAAFQTMKMVLPDSSAVFPQANVPDDPSIWSELVGSYRPRQGWNSNFRLLTSFGGSFRVEVRDDQLYIKSAIGTWRQGILLRAADVDDPLAFVTSSGTPIIFYRNPSSKKIEGFYLRFHNIIKRDSYDAQTSA
ncbi:MAG: serine hydrolase domain-containing protein [Chloroflexota bacterium]